MEFLYKWLALAAVQSAATMSPGPAFAITLRNASLEGRAAGILTSIGLGIGVALHVIFVIFGISVLVSKSELLFNLIKYSGAAYLVFIGIKGLLAKANKESKDVENRAVKNHAKWKRIQNGFLTNLLNPKAFVFFTAVYAQFITPETPLSVSAIYGLTSTFIEIAWFSAVTIFLTTPRIRKKFTDIAHWIDRICGGLLVALGIRLAM